MIDTLVRGLNPLWNRDAHTAVMQYIHAPRDWLAMLMVSATLRELTLADLAERARLKMRGPAARALSAAHGVIAVCEVAFGRRVDTFSGPISLPLRWCASHTRAVAVVSCGGTDGPVALYKTFEPGAAPRLVVGPRILKLPEPDSPAAWNLSPCGRIVAGTFNSTHANSTDRWPPDDRGSLRVVTQTTVVYTVGARQLTSVLRVVTRVVANGRGTPFFSGDGRRLLLHEDAGVAGLCLSALCDGNPLDAYASRHVYPTTAAELAALRSCATADLVLSPCGRRTVAVTLRGHLSIFVNGVIRHESSGAARGLHLKISADARHVAVLDSHGTLTLHDVDAVHPQPRSRALPLRARCFAWAPGADRVAVALVSLRDAARGGEVEIWTARAHMHKRLRVLAPTHAAIDARTAATVRHQADGYATTVLRASNQRHDRRARRLRAERRAALSPAAPPPRRLEPPQWQTCRDLADGAGTPATAARAWWRVQQGGDSVPALQFDARGELLAVYAGPGPPRLFDTRDF
jgi:hypothetical protein